MIDSNTILKKIDCIDDLPTLPSIVMEANKMLQDYNTPMEKLCQIIEKDQSMVPKLLKLVNSAFFGFQSKISNVSRAIALLGFNTVRGAIVSIGVIEAFTQKDSMENFDIKDFWTHSIAVAVTSKHLVGNINNQVAEEAFIGGLLHDIGKVVLSQYFQDLFCKVWTSVKKNNLTFYDAEKMEIPITHALIGAHLAEKWQLPTSLVDAIRCHHAVGKNVEDVGLPMIVYLADVIVNGLGVNSKNEINLFEVHPDAARAMKNQVETAPDWFPEVSEDIQLACDSFLGEVE